MTTTRLRTALLAVALLPALSAALLVRPAAGQDAAFGLYAMTVQSAGASIDGEIGAGGGLTVLDGGVPFVRGRLDSSPSADVRSASIEPGTLVRTVAGVVNTEAGEEVITIHSADAQYPGNEEANGDVLGSESAGPLTLSGFTARSAAHQTDIAGKAVMGEQTVSDGSRAAEIRAAFAPLRAGYPNVTEEATTDDSVVVVQQGNAEATASADPAGILTATSIGTVGRVSIAGEIVLEDVVGVATVRVENGTRTADASIAVGGATIAGVPVEITEDGVVAADQQLLPGQSVRDLTAAINDALAEANIRIEAIAPREETGDGSALADSGGIQITLATPPNPQVPGNDLTLTLGGAVATSADEPPAAPLPPVDLGDAPAGPVSDAPSTSTPSTGTFTPSAPTIQELVDEPATVPEPVAAPPASNPAPAEPQVLVAGRQVSAKTALAAFGGWQLMSLSICTLAAFSLKGGSLEGSKP